MFLSVLKKTSSRLFQARHISWYPKEALPLLPAVSYPHKLLKIALQNQNSQLPTDFVEQFSLCLSKIRAVQWNALAETAHHEGLHSYHSGKRLLEDLLQFENKLPQAFRDELSKRAERKPEEVFDMVRDAIQQIDFHRVHGDFESLRGMSSRK